MKSGICLFCMSLSLLLGIVSTVTQSALASILIHAWSNVLFSMFVYKLDTFDLHTVIAFTILPLVCIFIMSGGCLERKIVV